MAQIQFLVSEGSLGLLEGNLPLIPNVPAKSIFHCYRP